MMKKQNGIAGIDIVISLIIITIFISLIAVLTFNIQWNNEEIKRRSEATSFAIDKIEEIKGKGFSALPPLGQNTIDEYPDGYIEQNGSSTPYYQEIRVQDYSELEGNEGREAEVIKIVTVKISYKSGNNDENVEISTAISKED